MIAAYVEQHPGSPPTVKQHLAAIRRLFDWLVVGQTIPMNPASSVRGPKYVVERGKTPVLNANQARTLLDSIRTDAMVGLRDCALLALMSCTFARVSATVHMRVGLLPERQALVVLHPGVPFSLAAHKLMFLGSPVAGLASQSIQALTVGWEEGFLGKAKNTP